MLGLANERRELDGGEGAHPRRRDDFGQAEVAGNLDGGCVSVTVAAPELAADDPAGGVGAGDAQHLEAVAPGGRALLEDALGAVAGAEEEGIGVVGLASDVRWRRRVDIDQRCQVGDLSEADAERIDPVRAARTSHPPPRSASNHHAGGGRHGSM